MKYAILSDIHGNNWALEAVLADARQRSIEKFINLGDIYYGPLNPGGTFELLQGLDCSTVQGNQDRTIHQASPAEIGNNPVLAQIVHQLRAEAIARLACLPKTDVVSGEIFLCHGSPASDMAYLLEDVSNGFPLVRNEETILQDLDGVREPVILCGHTHIPRVVHLASGALIVNPGSVGLPAYDDDTPNYHVMETFTPSASYAILEKKAGAWYVEQLKIPYDFSPAVEQARHQGRTDWARWLATGRAAE